MWRFEGILNPIKNDLLAEFGMQNCRNIATPMEVNLKVYETPIVTDIPYQKLIFSLAQLTVTTRPDLAFSVSYLSHYLDKPKMQAWNGGRRILRNPLRVIWKDVQMQIGLVIRHR